MRSVAWENLDAVNLSPAKSSMKLNGHEETLESALTTSVDLAGSRERAAGIAAQDFDQLVRLHQRRIYRVLLTLVRDQDLARCLLGLPPERFCAYLIALGHPADRPLAPLRKINRRPFEEVVHHERW